MKLMRLAVTCGGTGGHFFPGLATAVEFQKQGGKVLMFLPGANAPGQCRKAEEAGLEAVGMAYLANYRSIKGFVKFFCGLFYACFTAWRLMRKNKIQALLSMGSFTSLPIFLAARFSGIPIVLHDGNARVGKANCIFADWGAKAIATAFPPVNQNLFSKTAVVTGMPLRAGLLEQCKLPTESAIDELNKIYHTFLTKDRFTLLITGGSQGAAALNTVLPQVFNSPDMPLDNFQVLHLTGKGKLAKTEKFYENCNFPYLLTESTDRMELFMAAANLVFSRAGGSTIAELQLFGKAAVLVPYPYAAENHQFDNAKFFADVCQGGVVVLNSNMSRERIVDILKRPVDFWKSCAVSSKNSAKPQATADLLELVNSAVI